MTIRRAHAPSGKVNLQAGGSIFSSGGPDIRVIALDEITLVASGGVVGTIADALHTQFTGTGTFNLFAGGQQNGISARITGNFNSLSLQFLNTPPGLVLFNNLLRGGQLLPGATKSTSDLFVPRIPINNAQYGQIDGQVSADFPGVFNLDNFAYAPDITIDTTGLDLLPLEGVELLPTAVPLPEEEEEKEETPPTVVSIPEDASAGGQALTNDQTAVNI